MTAPLLTLESGDRLTREEFEYRYAQCPHINKAELINGVVFVASPVRYRLHGVPHSQMMVWAGNYCIAIPQLLMAD